MMGLSGKYFRCAVLVFPVAAFAACSQPPGFYVVPEQKDLGLIDDDSRTAVAEFQLVNGMGRAVEIIHMFPSCTCADVQLRKNPIPPGESSTLKVTAQLADQGGRQEFSVFFVTDSAEFPSKRVSFTALAPAKGIGQRHLSIGFFYPGEAIDLVLPAKSISVGTVQLVATASGDGGITTHLVDTLSKGSRLVVKGTAPQTVGQFSVDRRFRESVPDGPSSGERLVELRLTGNVVARWDIPRELYCGFFSLTENGGTIPVTVKPNAAVIPANRRKGVSSVSATVREEWLLLKRQSVLSDRIELRFEVDSGKLKHWGAVQNSMELTIHYGGGDCETYFTKLYAHIEP